MRSRCDYDVHCCRSSATPCNRSRDRVVAIPSLKDNVLNARIFETTFNNAIHRCPIRAISLDVGPPRQTAIADLLQATIRATAGRRIPAISKKARLQAVVRRTFWRHARLPAHSGLSLLSKESGDRASSSRDDGHLSDVAEERSSARTLCHPPGCRLGNAINSAHDRCQADSVARFDSRSSSSICSMLFATPRPRTMPLRSTITK